MTQEEYLALKETMDNAQQDTTPYPILESGKLHVVGDANKTQVNKNDYTVQFRLPNGLVPEGKGQVTDKGTFINIDYKDVFISPRRDYDVTRILVKILPYFRKEKDGEVTDYTDEEIVQILLSLDDQIADLMYELVGKVLGIDKTLIDYITPSSLVINALKIMNDFPENINEADTFFDKSVQTPKGTEEQ